MATRNSDQLARRVLENMNFVRPGASPSTDEIATIKDRWAGVHAGLVDHGDAYWPRDAIPLAVFEPVAWIMALEVAPAFGALPIVLQAIGAPNAEEGKMPYMKKLRLHMEPDFNHEHERIIQF